MNAIQGCDGGVTIAIRVIPRASRDQIAGSVGDAIKVKLRAPPLDGRANEALARVLADALGVRPRQVTLLSGATSRDKRVRIEGVTCAAAERALAGA